MKTYAQYCPIARAAELLGERWSVIILRNILVGCHTFNEIAVGSPGLSRGLLSKRLRELERAGVIEIRPKADGPGSTYEPTQAGRELAQVMMALQNWGRRWAELKPEHAHPGVVLWVWVDFWLERDRLPRRRVVIRFEFPTLPAAARRSWMLVERGDAEYCLTHPGGEDELVVIIHDPVVFARWHMAEIEWADALRSGAIEVHGSKALARALPTWNRRGWAADDPRGRFDPPENQPVPDPLPSDAGSQSHPGTRKRKGAQPTPVGTS
ncbi:MAG TPA: helix-turn-helix domain-containing protein [Acidimicrobiia bacterium]|nr:helix-turn-helix domain-containing protein [Acidimicrobiia bacterium]